MRNYEDIFNTLADLFAEYHETSSEAKEKVIKEAVINLLKEPDDHLRKFLNDAEARIDNGEDLSHDFLEEYIAAAKYYGSPYHRINEAERLINPNMP